MVYAAFSGDETIMGFAFPREERLGSPDEVHRDRLVATADLQLSTLEIAEVDTRPFVRDSTYERLTNGRALLNSPPSKGCSRNGRPSVPETVSGTKTRRSSVPPR